MSNKRTSQNSRFSHAPPKIPREAELVNLLKRRFPDKGDQPEWLTDAARRLHRACRMARLHAIASLEPTAEEGQKRMNKIAKLCEQILEALTGSADGSEIPPYIDVALSTKRVESTMSYSHDVSASLTNAVAGIRLVRERTLATDASTWDEFEERHTRVPDFFKNALQEELEKFWQWATGEVAHFSTPHQKCRGKLASSERPKGISTEKTGPFVDFFQEFVRLLGEYPVSGRSIAGRMNRLKKKREKRAIRLRRPHANLDMS